MQLVPYRSCFSTVVQYTLPVPGTPGRYIHSTRVLYMMRLAFTWQLTVERRDVGVVLLTAILKPLMAPSLPQL